MTASLPYAIDPVVVSERSAAVGKTRVNVYAPKQLKSLLHLAGRPVPSNGSYLQQRGIIGPPMRLVLNAVRNNGTAHASYSLDLLSGSSSAKI